MDILTVIVIAFGLSLDAFSVAVVSGAIYKKLQVRHALRMALFFGGFQALMPILGWACGLAFRRHIQAYDHWIAFGLLTLIGCKMIYESTKMHRDPDQYNPADMLVLLALSIATSIDALAVGIALSLLTHPIWTAVLIIGLVTFLFSYVGVYIGKRLGHFFESKIEVFGGIVLIAIGLRILLQHLLAPGA